METKSRSICERLFCCITLCDFWLQTYIIVMLNTLPVVLFKQRIVWAMSKNTRTRPNKWDIDMRVEPSASAAAQGKKAASQVAQQVEQATQQQENGPQNVKAQQEVQEEVGEEEEGEAQGQGEESLPDIGSVFVLCSMVAFTWDW